MKCSLQELLNKGTLLDTTLTENIRFGGLSEFEPLHFQIPESEIDGLGLSIFQLRESVIINDQLFFRAFISNTDYESEKNAFIISLRFDHIDTSKLILLNHSTAYSHYVDPITKYSMVPEKIRGPIESGIRIYKFDRK